jgi:hypothetical protein
MRIFVIKKKTTFSSGKIPKNKTPVFEFGKSTTLLPSAQQYPSTIDICLE